MKANAQPLCEILFSNSQFIIPFFQRFYSWDRDNWERLATDIQDLMGDDAKKKHFLGPLVCSALSPVPGRMPQFQLIDGQQRLTTLSLLLAAIRDEATKAGDNGLATEIELQYLINQFGKDLGRLKLIPRTGDRELFAAVVEKKAVANNESSRLLAAHRFFCKFVRTHAHKDPEFLRRLFELIVARLYLVAITLDEEDPYEIFESLNSTGLPLQESDLIRNFLFMQIDLSEQEQFQIANWSPFESEFDPVPGRQTPSPTGLYRDFLMRNGQYSKAKATFSHFKRFYESTSTTPQDMVAELKRFVGFAQTILNEGAGRSLAIRRVLREFVWMDTSTAHPVVLNLMDKLDTGAISEQEFVGCVSSINSFILRRSICGESTRSYGVWFCELAGQLDTDIRSKLQGYLHHRGWPDDETFKRCLIDFQIYRREFKKCRIILEALERADGHKEGIDLTVPNIQIEHVMPQKLSANDDGRMWKAMLGPSYKKDHERWLHTIGNLTLTGYNPSLSNKSYETKRILLRESKLSLNKTFSDQKDWNASRIKSRGEALANAVAQIWFRPLSSIVYVPPTNKQHAAEKQRERRQRYWQELAEMLEHSQTSLRPVRQVDGNICDFHLGMADVGLSARFSPAKNHLVLRMIFSRARGREMFTALLADREAIEHEMTVPTAWESGDKPTIIATKTDVYLRERYDWLDHHKWITSALCQFESALVNRLRPIHADVQEKSASKQAMLDYWIAFHQRLFERKVSLLVTTPLPQHWINIALGRSSVWTYASLNGTESKIAVSLIFDTPVSPVYFPQIEADKSAIEEELGTQLEWKSGPAIKQWKAVLNRDGVDVADRNDWQNQHDWMIDKLLDFDRVFRARVQKLSTDDDANEESA